jgi:hypothetical protein
LLAYFTDQEQLQTSDVLPLVKSSFSSYQGGDPSDDDIQIAIEEFAPWLQVRFALR